MSKNTMILLILVLLVGAMAMAYMYIAEEAIEETKKQIAQVNNE